MSKPKRKPRSPFHLATKSDLRMLRLLAIAAENWKRSAAAGEYYLLPTAWSVLGNDGGTYQMRILDRFEARAWRALSHRPGYDAIREQHDLARMKRWDPKRYELRMLRMEIAEYREECRDRGVAAQPLPDGVATMTNEAGE